LDVTEGEEEGGGGWDAEDAKRMQAVVDLAQEDLDQEEKMVKELKAQVGTHRTVK
jgi:hypothetical protein